MNKITSINEFIKFLLDLFNDEFAYLYDNIDALLFFQCGACYDFALIIKNYFPEAELVVNNNYNHCAVLYENKIYDALSAVDIETALKLGFSKEEYEKNLDSFTIYQEKEIDNFEIPFKRLRVEEKPISLTLINEIEKIDTVSIENKKI